MFMGVTSPKLGMAGTRGLKRTKVMQRGIGVNEIKNHLADLDFIIPPPGPLDVFALASFASVGGVYLSS